MSLENQLLDILLQIHKNQAVSVIKVGKVFFRLMSFEKELLKILIWDRLIFEIKV